ncbi:MAG: nitroreductase/quinone reductase family protein, partial [Nitrososphaeraceae archaeon]
MNCPLQNLIERIESTTISIFGYLRWNTGKEHRIEIWFVEHNKRYYVISERRERAHWVQNISNNPRITFSVHDRTFEGTARLVDPKNEPELTNRISELMDSKYKWHQGLIVELT